MGFVGFKGDFVVDTVGGFGVSGLLRVDWGVSFWIYLIALVRVRNRGCVGGRELAFRVCGCGNLEMLLDMTLGYYMWIC